jgi:hypothetical protein
MEVLVGGPAGGGLGNVPEVVVLWRDDKDIPLRRISVPRNDRGRAPQLDIKISWYSLDCTWILGRPARRCLIIVDIRAGTCSGNDESRYLIRVGVVNQSWLTSKVKSIEDPPAIPHLVVFVSFTVALIIV